MKRRESLEESTIDTSSTSASGKLNLKGETPSIFKDPAPENSHE